MKIRLFKEQGTWVLYLGRLHLAVHLYEESGRRKYWLRRKGNYGYALYLWRLRFYASLRPADVPELTEPGWGETPE